MDYQVRFVPKALVEDLLFCWRLTAVGHSVQPGVVPAGVNAHGRHGRMLRAVAMFDSRNPGVQGAYKDLDGLLGVGPGQINV